MSFKLVPFERLGTVDCSHYRNYDRMISLAVYGIFSVKELRDLENWV